MASPFFSSYWNQPSESRYSPSSIPLKRKPETPAPKVISIPVHFVGSENSRSNSDLNRSDSALKIQKVFRGFLVRKSVSKIVSIKNEVEEIERRIAQNETVELIRKDSKERLRINETLMALLFKLDSVRGIDSGVRELRKGVIRKAIGLQEKVDALVLLPMESAAAPEPNDASVDSGGDTVDSIRSDSGEIVDDHPICDDEMPVENTPAVVSIDEMPIENDEIPIENVTDSMDQQKEEGSCVVKEVVTECNTMNSMEREEEETIEDVSGNKEDMMREEGGEKKSGNEELMLRMMSELVEKNEVQTRMINSLTHRVAQLEKAFLCDKLRRSHKKKRRQQHDADADGKQQ